MLIYWVNLLLVLIWSLLSKASTNKYFSKLIYFTMFIQLFLLLALRAHSVGSDTQNYIYWFNTSKLYSFWDFEYARHEIGYLLLNKLLSFINSEQIFISIVGFIPLFIFFRFILQESKIPWLSIYLLITLGFYTNIFNIIRHIIALSIILLSYKYLIKNDFKKFITMVIIASFFHITALAFIPVYFFRNVRLKYKNISMYIVSSVIIFLFAHPIVHFALELFSYIDYEIHSNGGLTLLIVMLVTLIGGLIFSKAVIFKNPRAIVLYNIVFLGIMVQVLALEFSLFTRVTLYFMIFFIIFIPEVLSNIKNIYLRSISILLVIFLTGIQYYLVILTDKSKIVPYYFFFQ